MKLKRSKKETTKLNIAIIVTVLIVIIFCIAICLTINNNTRKETNFIYLKSVLSNEVDNEILKKTITLLAKKE